MERAGLIARWGIGSLLTAALAAPAAWAIDVPDYDFEWCVIGDAGNPGYPGPIDFSYFPIIGRGRVNHVYRMAQTEVTTAQWVEFYNALAEVAPEIAWAERPGRSGAVFVGTQAEPRWAVGPEPGDAMRPVEIPVCAAARLCNWLHNGKARERWAFMDGAYDTTTFGWSDDLDDFTDDYTRRGGALFFMPSLDEWMKAVYYDPARSERGGWWHHPYGSDEPAVAGWPGDPGAETAVGTDDTVWTQLNIPLLSYPDAATPWGLRDASGGMSEWSEVEAWNRGLWGTGMLAFGSAGDSTVEPDVPWYHPDKLLFVKGAYPDRLPWGVNSRLASIAPCASDTHVPYGVLDLGDIVSFINGYLDGDPASDLSGDGILDHEDIERFIAAFAMGCEGY